MVATHYDLLGVSMSASQAEIKQAYRDICRDFHPDANMGDPVATELMAEVNEAYSILKDPAKRAEYDNSIPVEVAVRPSVLDFGVLKLGDAPVIKRVMVSWDDRSPKMIHTPITRDARWIHGSDAWWVLDRAPMGKASVTFELRAAVVADMLAGKHLSYFDVVADGQAHRVQLIVHVAAAPSKPKAAGPKSAAGGSSGGSPTTAARSDPKASKHRTTKTSDIRSLIPIVFTLFGFISLGAVLLAAIIWALVRLLVASRGCAEDLGSAPLGSEPIDLRFVTVWCDLTDDACSVLLLEENRTRSSQFSC